MNDILHPADEPSTPSVGKTAHAVRGQGRPPSSWRSARRLRREKRTVAVMIQMYCRDQHRRALLGCDSERASLCSDCAELLIYALKRVEACPFGSQKPVCSRCTVHCYRPLMRDRVRKAMRYAGPRMIQRHPYLALRHLLDRRRQPPQIARD